MKLERSNIEFPIWRKKVDKSLFEYNGTTIPTWACRMWGLDAIYGTVISKADPQSSAAITFNRRHYDGHVTVAKEGRISPAFRLWYDTALCLELKRSFLMSYMRSLEGRLQKDCDVEKTIPFWEFLDIEFDAANRVFRFDSYYAQQPSFPHLFARLIGSPALQKVADEIEGKDGLRIYKQDWKPREQVEFEIGAHNVIYTLLDTRAKLLYIGEAFDLIARLLQPHRSIPDWNFFRYDVLPSALESYRVSLERMLIRSYAAVLKNKKGVEALEINGYQLANDKVDK